MANKENVQKWVDALRSGEFSQTTGRLCRKYDAYNKPAGHCCLGVAAEISGVVTEQHEDSTGVVSFAGESAFLPWRVAKWLGFGNRNPQVRTEEGWKPLTELNDEKGLNFEQIADLIDGTYLNGK